MSAPIPASSLVRAVEVTVDGRSVRVAEGASLLDACAAAGIGTPTLCYAKNLTPVNVCRLCVVELSGARTLVPSCSRRAEPGMQVQTDSERVRAARRGVLELLASSVDLSTTPGADDWMARYGARADRFGPPSSPSEAGLREAARAGHHHAPDGASAATVRQPVKIDNELFVRDYGKCVLCYRCVEACGEDAQMTFAIAVAGRGFEARVATEFDGRLPESACVYCGNCVGACPTGALMPVAEYELRQAGRWDEGRQSTTDTICPYCGVGCTLTLHVQDEAIVKVTSPSDSGVTGGHLCIKGRYGFGFVGAVEPT